MQVLDLTPPTPEIHAGYPTSVPDEWVHHFGKEMAGYVVGLPGSAKVTQRPREAHKMGKIK